jgi:hypothetical protein
MCRSIKVLRRSAEPVTPDDISAAALQFVRKVSGYHKPSKMNQAAFDAAVREIAGATNRLLENLAEAQSNRRISDRAAGV